MIEKYIKFAIDNWYWKLDNDWKIKTNIITQEKDYNDEICLDETLHWTFILYWCCDVWCDIISLENIITSKEFIEAIEKWMIEKLELDYDADLIDDITIKQSLAIRDNQLDSFIKNILGE